MTDLKTTLKESCQFINNECALFRLYQSVKKITDNTKVPDPYTGEWIDLFERYA